MTEEQLVSEIKRIGAMHYNPELAEHQEYLKSKLRVLQASRPPMGQGE